MTKLTLVSAMFVLGLAGCSSQPAASSPADEPAVPESEGTEPDVTEPDVTEPEPTEPSEPEPDVTEPDPEPESGKKPKRPCDAYPNKQMCQVVRGCAWHDVKGCIDYKE